MAHAIARMAESGRAKVKEVSTSYISHGVNCVVVRSYCLMLDRYEVWKAPRITSDRDYIHY